jgi:hypothetical protein
MVVAGAEGGTVGTDRGEVRRGVAGVGHRKIAALMRADGYAVSTSTVEPALRRRGLLLPRGYRADRSRGRCCGARYSTIPRHYANQVWQTDFSEFETSGGGIWRICAVIDYATKYCLAITVTPTARGADALACLRLAVTEAEQVFDLDDLRADRGLLKYEHLFGGVITDRDALDTEIHRFRIIYNTIAAPGPRRSNTSTAYTGCDQQKTAR